jgi:hypothetical protein
MDIFLSYAREDRAYASQLAELFTQLGWSVWWDRAILPGSDFESVIAGELAAARCVIVLWSSEAVRSDFVRDEAQAAKRRGVLIQCAIGADSIEPPLGFRSYQVANLVGWRGDAEDANFTSLRDAVALLALVSGAVRQGASPRRVRRGLGRLSRWVIAGAAALMVLAVVGWNWIEPHAEPFVGPLAFNGSAKGIDVSPDGMLIAAGGGNSHTVQLWNAGTGEQGSLLVGDSVVSAVAFSHDGTLLATDSFLFDLATGERLARLGGGYDVAFSPDNAVVGTASGYQMLLGTKLFGQKTGMEVRRVSDEYASALAFSYDSKFLATATGYLAQGVRLWSLESYQLTRTLEGPSGDVAFSPDGRYIAAAGGGTVRLFRFPTGERVRDIAGNIVAFSPSGSELATVGEDARVRLYDPSNGNPIRTLDNVYAKELVFTPDGQRIVTVAPDGSVHVSKVR